MFPSLKALSFISLLSTSQFYSSMSEEASFFKMPIFIFPACIYKQIFIFQIKHVNMSRAQTQTLSTFASACQWEEAAAGWAAWTAKHNHKNKQTPTKPVSKLVDACRAAILTWCIQLIHASSWNNIKQKHEEGKSKFRSMPATNLMFFLITSPNWQHVML